MNNTINVGVIADMQYSISPAFSSYFYACKEFFKNVTIINSVNDLESIDLVLCGNEHFYNHLVIWSNNEFINRCNEKRIPFFAHTVEHINTPIYPHNIEIQNKLEKFKLLNQRCWDINDANEKNRNIARVLLSKKFFDYTALETKKDKIVFVGKLYPNRKELINELSKHIDIDVLERSNGNYYDFISKLAEYKYVLSPKSQLVNGIPGRFYEALWVDSIPLQEIYDNTLNYYTTEKNIENSIFFKSAEELVDKIKSNNFISNIKQPKMFLEDELVDFFKEFNIL